MSKPLIIIPDKMKTISMDTDEFIKIIEKAYEYGVEDGLLKAKVETVHIKEIKNYNPWNVQAVPVSTTPSDDITPKITLTADDTAKLGWYKNGNHSTEE